MPVSRSFQATDVRFAPVVTGGSDQSAAAANAVMATVAKRETPAEIQNFNQFETDLSITGLSLVVRPSIRRFTAEINAAYDHIKTLRKR